MAYVAYSNSPIHVRETGGAVDPGYGQGGPHPDQGLPPGMGHPDNSLPMPPPGVWPPPVPSHPIVIAPPGTPPGTIWPPVNPPRPDNTLPGSGARPDNTLPGSQPGIDNTLPGSMPRPDNTLPSGKFWVVVGIPGYGWKYVCVDPSLTPDNSLPGGSGGRPDNTLPGSQPGIDNTLPGQPARPDNTLPPTATPRR